MDLKLLDLDEKTRDALLAAILLLNARGYSIEIIKVVKDE